MGTVIAYKAISIDGYAAGPDGDLSRLHSWMDSPAAKPVTAGFFEAGAVLMGLGTMDAGEEPWGDEPVFPMPVVVLSHQPRERWVKGGTTFTFVDDLERALSHAQAVAGDAPVVVMGASVVQQCLAAGWLDELRLHLVPIILGGGTRLFADGAPIDLEPLGLQQIDAITHLTYRVRR